MKTRLSISERRRARAQMDQPTNDQPKHTQGTWYQMGTHLNKEAVYIANGDQRKIAAINVIYEADKGANWEEAEANAQRIVKAVNVLSDLEDKIKAMNSARMLNGLTGEGEELLDYLTELLKQAGGK